MPARGDEALKIDARVGERGTRLGHREFDALDEAGRLRDEFQAPPASAADRLDEDRPPDFLGQSGGLFRQIDRAAWRERQSGLDRMRAGAKLVANRLEVRVGRSDEDEAGSRAERARRTFSDRKPYPG